MLGCLECQCLVLVQPPPPFFSHYSQHFIIHKLAESVSLVFLCLLRNTAEFEKMQLQFHLLFSILVLGTSVGAQTLIKCIKSALDDQNDLYAFPFHFFDSLEDPFYQVSDIHPYNLDHMYTPAAVTYPTSAQQVAGVIACANQFQKPVAARSGGHSFLNHGMSERCHDAMVWLTLVGCLGLGGGDGYVVVDTKHLDGFRYSATDHTVVFGPGNKLGPLTKKLESVGRTMAYGENADVGAGGHVTIGGIGLMSRQLGLALDQVRSMQAVLANGTIITASPNINPDLFWALRGAGSSFAIVTEFTAVTAPAVTVTSFNFNVSTGRIQDLADTWKAWQDLVAQPGLSRLFGCTLTLTPLLGKGAVLMFQGTYFGSKDGLDRIQLEAVLPKRKPGYDIQSKIITTGVNDFFAFGQDILGVVPMHFYVKSLKFTNQTLLSTDQARAMFQYIDKTPKGVPLWFIIWDLEGGAISDPKQTDTAYWHRDALFFMTSYVIDVFSTSKVNQKARGFLEGLNGMVRGLRDGFDESAYPGYVDDGLKEAQKAYWGGNLEKLKGIKRTIDPGNLFRNGQSVPL